MAQPALQACVLREDLASLDLGTQLEYILNCKLSDTELLIETEKRRRELAAHIEACEPQ